MNLADPTVLSLLKSVAEASPRQETLPSPRWTLVWEDYLTVTGGVRTLGNGVNARSFRIPGLGQYPELRCSFSHSGLYTLEITAASDSGLFDPIQYPVLVSPYLVFQDNNRHIHWLDSDKNTPVNGTVYAATVFGEGLQIRRIANLNQYNHSPVSVPGARFLILSNGSNGVTIIPNTELPTYPTPGELWIYGDSAQTPSQSILMVLASDLKNRVPQLGRSESIPILDLNPIDSAAEIRVAHGIGTIDIAWIPRSEMVVIKRQGSARRLHRLPAVNGSDHFTLPNEDKPQSLRGPVFGSTDLPDYAVGDSVKITVSSEKSQTALIEFPEGLGGGEVWLKLGNGRETLTRKVSRKSGDVAYVKMTMGVGTQLKTHLIPIHLRSDGVVPTAEFSVDVDDLRPGEMAHLKIRCISTQNTLLGRHYVVAAVAPVGAKFTPPPVVEWVRQQVLKRSSVAIRWPAPLLGAVQTQFDPDGPANVAFQIPNTTGELVLLLISQIDGVGIQQTIHRFPIRRPLEVHVSLPTNAHPNDVIKWSPSVRNNEKQPISGTLKTYWNDTAISSQSIVVAPQGVWSEYGAISMPATGESVTGVVKTVFTPASGNPVIVKSLLKITPIHLPKIIRSYDILAVDSDTPSTDISGWLGASREPVWITAHPGIIRLLLLQSIPIAPLSDLALAAYQKIEADQLLSSVRNDVWGSLIVRELRRLSTAMDTLRTRGIGIEDLPPQHDRLLTEALVALSQINSQVPSATRAGELGYLLSNISPSGHLFTTGFALGVLYRCHSTQTPEFFESIANQFRSQFDNPLFVRGFQLAESPVTVGQSKIEVAVPTGNGLTDWLRGPIDDPVEMLERGAMISTLFNSKGFRYQLIGDRKVIHEQGVKLVGAVTLPERLEHPHLMANNGQRFIVFRKAIHPLQVESKMAKWEVSSEGVTLVIPLPQNSTSNVTIAIPVTTGLAIKTIQGDKQILRSISDAEWVYVAIPRGSHFVRVTYAILYKGFRPASVSWVQTHQTRRYIRIPKVEL